MPRRGSHDGNTGASEQATSPVRSFWSGTITFGLVSIPVDLYSATRPRQTSMKMVDKDGHALGRQYHCSKEGKRLTQDDLVRGYETDSGKVVVITDEEFEALAPESSRDIELRRFVPLDQIPPLYFQRPYFLAPAGRSTKAYHLLAKTMERTGRVAIGNFVMRGKEYLVAILSEGGVLRAETLRYADELRTPQAIGLPKRAKVAAKKVSQFIKEIEALTRSELDMAELEDREAEALQALAEAKRKRGEDIIEQAGLEEEDPEAAESSNVVDLMAVLRKSLSKKAVVTTARSAPPPSPRAERHTDHPRPHAKAASGRRGQAHAGDGRAESLTRSSKSELLKRAAQLQIAGRSKMDKDQLVRAIRRAG